MGERRRRGILIDKDTPVMPGFQGGGRKRKPVGKPTGSGFASMRERQRAREVGARKRKGKGGLLSPARESLLVGRDTRVA